MRFKRVRAEPDQPEFKNGEEALKWCEESLREISGEWINLCILEAVYSGSYLWSLPQISLQDLLSTLSSFRVHGSMPSLEQVFRNMRISTDCRSALAGSDLVTYSLDYFLALYRTQLIIKRSEIGGRLVTLAIIADEAFTKHPDPKLESFCAFLEDVQSNFHNKKSPRFYWELCKLLLSRLREDLFLTYVKLEAKINEIIQGRIQDLSEGNENSDIKVTAYQIIAKASIFSNFIQYLLDYLISEKIETEFNSQIIEIKVNYFRLRWDAKFILELLKAGNLKNYLQNTKALLNHTLIEYQSLSATEFGGLDFVSVDEILRVNILKLNFFKRLINDNNLDYLLEKFSIMLELLALRSNQEANLKSFFGKSLPVHELEYAVETLSTDDAHLKQLHERARRCENESPFLPDIFKEYFRPTQEWRASLVIVAAKAYDSEIENINVMLEAFENILGEGVPDITLIIDCLGTCSNMQEYIQNSKRAYSLVASFHKEIRMEDSLNDALSIVADWRSQLVNFVKGALSEKNLEQFESLLPLCQAKAVDWREIFLGALGLWADRQGSEIISGINGLDKIQDLLGNFLRGKGSIKKTYAMQLFSSEPESVGSVCEKVVNWLELKIQLIKELLHFSAKLEVQNDLSDFLSLWMGRQSMLEKLADAYQRLRKLPIIQKNQLTNSQVDTLQKNGRLLAFAQNLLKNLRHSINTLIDNPVADVAKAEKLQVEATNALLELKDKFSSLDKCKQFLEAINPDALVEEHRLFFIEFYFPQQQAEQVTVCEELTSFQEILNRYLELAKQSEGYGIQGSGNNAEPESPGEKSKCGLDEEPSSPLRPAF